MPKESHQGRVNLIRPPRQRISYLAGSCGLKKATTLKKPSGTIQRLRAMGRRSENVSRTWASSRLSFSSGRGSHMKTSPPLIPHPPGNGRGAHGGSRNAGRQEGLACGLGHVLNVPEFRTPKIAQDMGCGARKLSFNISAAGGSGAESEEPLLAVPMALVGGPHVFWTETETEPGKTVKPEPYWLCELSASHFLAVCLSFLSCKRRIA